jgi:hypothetical protein
LALGKTKGGQQYAKVPALQGAARSDVDGICVRYEGMRKMVLCAVELGFIPEPEGVFVAEGEKG